MLPKYPAGAKQALLEGIVLLQARVGTDGTVTAIKVLRAEPAGLTEAATEALQQWRYEPARDSAGKPVYRSLVDLGDRNPVISISVSGQKATVVWLTRSDGKSMADAHLRTWEHFRHDMIDLENGVAALAQAVGCPVEIHDDTSPTWEAAPAIASLEEIDRLKPIDPHQDGTLPEMLKATRRIAREVGGHICLLSEADQGPFSLAGIVYEDKDTDGVKDAGEPGLATRSRQRSRNTARSSSWSASISRSAGRSSARSRSRIIAARIPE